MNSYISGFRSQYFDAVAGTTWNPNGEIFQHPMYNKKYVELKTYSRDPGMIYYSVKDIKNEIKWKKVGETAITVASTIIVIAIMIASRGAAGAAPKPAMA